MAADKQESWAKLPYWIHQEGLCLWSRVIYAVLLDESRGTGTVKIGLRRLASVLVGDKNTIARAISDLEGAGLLEVIRGRKGQANTYRLTVRTAKTVPHTGTVAKKKASRPRDNNRPSRGTPCPATGTLVSPYRDTRPEQTEYREDRPAGKPRKPRAEPKPRARCEVWDTLCELFGDVVDPVADAKRIGLVVKKLKAKGATAAEMNSRAERYKRTWPDMEFTPEALNKHWKRFENESAGTDRPGRVKAPPGKYDKENLRLFEG